MHSAGSFLFLVFISPPQRVWVHGPAMYIFLGLRERMDHTFVLHDAKSRLRQKKCGLHDIICAFCEKRDICTVFDRRKMELYLYEGHLQMLVFFFILQVDLRWVRTRGTDLHLLSWIATFSIHGAPNLDFPVILVSYFEYILLRTSNISIGIFHHFFFFFLP